VTGAIDLLQKQLVQKIERAIELHPSVASGVQEGKRQRLTS
jgi:hypothetical protein